MDKTMINYFQKQAKNTPQKKMNLSAKNKNIMGNKRKIVFAELLDFVATEAVETEYSSYHGISILCI